MDARFEPWRISDLRARGDAASPDGRVRGHMDLTLTDDSGASATHPSGAFELLGPGDVAGLAHGTITRRYPQPGIANAERTKMALVELVAPDLPWRYSPDTVRDDIPTADVTVKGHGIRPWLVLVVGTEGGDELTMQPGGRVTLGSGVQAAHPLADSWRWAHVHVVGDTTIGRIVCPRGMLPTTDYRACLVPAFLVEGDTLGDAWPAGGGAPVTLPCYDTWTFRTADEGDFPQLAAKLQPADWNRLGSRFGRADVTFGDHDEFTLHTAGALTRVPSPTPDPADAPVDGTVAARTAGLLALRTSPSGRWMLTVPAYHEPFTAPGTDPTTGWALELKEDPRRRGGAGLGRWASIAWQDRIADAAAARVGDLAIARDRVGHLALGLEATRSLWRRHVPPDSDPLGRLAVLAPVLGRLPSADGGTVLGTISGRTPRLAAALWSSAARRALRPGPARTATAQDGAARPAAVLGTAATCADVVRDPAEIPLGGEDDHGFLQALTGLHETLWHLGRTPDCEPVDLGELGRRVADAVDPTVDRPVVVDRVLGTLPGITSLGPIELEPELDLPLWRFLSESSPDWLLPGVGDLQENDVVGLSTNPGFVESFLVGANHGATAELRWRNVPLRTRWSPLRKFWQRKSGGLDIEPIGRWAESAPLGDASLQPAPGGTEAVVVFRTTLFRRYPGTVVYLYHDDSGAWAAPPEDKPLADGQKVFPSFTGTIGDDVVFFGFPVAPSALTDHWVVLEEPPAGYRFFSQPSPPAASPNAAQYGFDTFAVPVRVMIGQLMEGA